VFESSGCNPIASPGQASWRQFYETYLVLTSVRFSERRLWPLRPSASSWPPVRPAAKANDWDDCNRRVSYTEWRYHEAVEHSGPYSREARPLGARTPRGLRVARRICVTNIGNTIATGMIRY